MAGIEKEKDGVQELVTYDFNSVVNDHITAVKVLCPSEFNFLPTLLLSERMTNFGRKG